MCSCSEASDMLLRLKPTHQNHDGEKERGDSFNPPNDIGAGVGRCRVCEQSVFIAQRLVINGQLYHRICFRCARCNSQLSMANCYETQSAQFVCETCPDEECIDGNRMKFTESGHASPTRKTHFSDVPVSDKEKSTIDDDQLVLNSKNKRISLVSHRKMLFENIAGTEMNISSLTDDAKATKAASKQEKNSASFGSTNHSQRKLSIKHTDTTTEILDVNTQPSKIFDDQDKSFKEINKNLSKSSDDLCYRSNQGSDYPDNNNFSVLRKKSISPDVDATILSEKTEKSSDSALTAYDVSVNNSLSNNTDDLSSLENTKLKSSDDSLLSNDEGINSITSIDSCSKNNSDVVLSLETVDLNYSHPDSSFICSETDETVHDVKEISTTTENSLVLINNTATSNVLKSDSESIQSSINDDTAISNVLKSDPESIQSSINNDTAISNVLKSDPEGIQNSTNGDTAASNVLKSDSESIPSSMNDASLEDKTTTSLSPIKVEEIPDQIEDDQPSESAELSNDEVANVDDKIEVEFKTRKEGHPAEITLKEGNDLPVAKSEQAASGSTSNSYPKGLNPFGDEDEDEDDEMEDDAVPTKPRKSKNPFGSDSEEETEEVEIVKTPVPKPRTSIGPRNTAYNPFPSDEESLSQVPDSTSPTPITRKLKPEVSPIAIKPPASRHSRQGSTSSIGSTVSTSTLSPHKKKPAPQPPSVLSPKYRKSKPAPPPPSNLPKSPVQPISTSASIPTSPSSSSLSLLSAPSSPKSFNKADKESANRLQRAENPVFEPHKSVSGQWKRKKGPAPQRPVPIKRQVREPMCLNQIKQELADIEIKQQELERQGVKLEQSIRDGSADQNIAPAVEDMMSQLFELVNEKNELQKRQSELMYMRRQHNLEQEHADLEYQIRCLMLCPEANKTDSDKELEEQLIQRLVEVVERRNEIVENLEVDRQKEIEEQKNNSSVDLYSLGSSTDGDPASIDKTTLKKKEKKSRKWKKTKKSEDSDKDCDNTDTISRKSNRLSWFGTLKHLPKKM